ncbi:MAG TPA: XamI family restriction endonuclease [Actinomycetota bacterium]
MAVNADKPTRWKDDIARSVDLYNDWFMRFAPVAFRETRVKTTVIVEEAMVTTKNMRAVTPALLRTNPALVPMLRMTTAPPLARDRLVGLAGVTKSLIDSMEKENRVPPRMKGSKLDEALQRIGTVLEKLIDSDIFPWLGEKRAPSKTERHRAATIVADRMCGAHADPIIRNAQEKRQLEAIEKWLKKRGYRKGAHGIDFRKMDPGTYAFRLNVPVTLEGGTTTVNIPVDAVIMPLKAKAGDLPVLVEAKSAGDFTNPNKRRKEEAKKVSQLTMTYGKAVCYVLFLCGYFDQGYLGYEAADGIDWVWEHRIEDLKEFGL